MNKQQQRIIRCLPTSPTRKDPQIRLTVRHPSDHSRRKQVVSLSKSNRVANQPVRGLLYLSFMKIGKLGSYQTKRRTFSGKLHLFMLILVAQVYIGCASVNQKPVNDFVAAPVVSSRDTTPKYTSAFFRPGNGLGSSGASFGDRSRMEAAWSAPYAPFYESGFGTSAGLTPLREYLRTNVAGVSPTFDSTYQRYGGFDLLKSSTDISGFSQTNQQTNQ